MPHDTKDLAWNLFSDLRKELVELQKIRSQIIGVKLTFVATGIALIAARREDVPSWLFVIPAFAAIFFDLLIHSYSFSIKRTGFYCREYLEPILRLEYGLRKDQLLWEEFMACPQAGRNVSLWGNVGITGLAVVLAGVLLFYPFNIFVSVPLLVCLAGLLSYDVVALYKPSAFSDPDYRYVYYNNPKPCVAIMIENDKGQVLLARRGSDPARGKWDIPGGFIDPGESAENAVVREAAEEIHEVCEKDGTVLRERPIQVRIKALLGTMPDTYGEKKLPTLNLGFVACPKGKLQPELRARSDVAELQWFALDSLPQDMAFRHQRKMLQLYREWRSCP